MSVVWTSGYGKNVGREGIGERGRVQDAGGVSIRRYGYGEFLPILSCSLESNMIGIG